MNPFEAIEVLPLDRQLCMVAFSNVSWTPEKRGERCQLDFMAHLLDFRSDLDDKTTERPDIRAEVAAKFAIYADRYRARYMAYLSAQSRCISSFIVGPSNFPAARAEKRNNVCHKRLNELVCDSEKDRERIYRLLVPRHLQTIRTEDADATEILGARLEATKQGADRMVEVNALYRKLRRTVDTDEAAYALLFEVITEEEQREIRTNLRIWKGRQPYPPFSITNARARQKATESRLVVIERTQALESREWDGQNARVVDNTEANRIQILFPGKPDEATRTELKRNGFRWAPSSGAWQAYRTYARTLDTAKRIAGVTA